jgi:hypothetical protein
LHAAGYSALLVEAGLFRGNSSSNDHLAETRRSFG